MNEKQMTLGTDYTRAVDPVGWYASEKLWDIRCYWDGSKFWTRGGKQPKLPASFTKQMPKGIELDGGIYCGRGGQEAARKLCQYWHWPKGIEPMFMIYDVPQAFGNWAQRIETAAMINHNCPVAHTVNGWVVESIAQLQTAVAMTLQCGGEGIMIRNPKITRYECGLTSNLLKIKNPNVL